MSTPLVFDPSRSSLLSAGPPALSQNSMWRGETGLSGVSALSTNGSWDEKDSTQSSSVWGVGSKPAPAIDPNVMVWAQGGSQPQSNTSSGSATWGQVDSQSQSSALTGSSAWGQPSSQSMTSGSGSGAAWGQTPVQPTPSSQPDSQSISSSPQPLSSWAAAAGKGLNHGHSGSTTLPPQVSVPSSTGPSSASNPIGSHDNTVTNSVSRVKNEEVERLKVVALNADNWGQSVINQESSWNLPPSPPQSAPKVESASQDLARCTTSGTEIWESAVRVKTRTGSTGSASASSQSAIGAQNQQNNPQSWAPNAPANHIGGTWGEEEDQSNVWSGIPPQGGHPSSANGPAPPVPPMPMQPLARQPPMGWGDEPVIRQPPPPIIAPTTVNPAWNPAPVPPVEKKWVEKSWGDAPKLNNYAEYGARMDSTCGPNVAPTLETDPNSDNGTAIWGGGGATAAGTASSSSSGSKHSNGGPLIGIKEETNGFGTWSPVPRKDSSGWEDDPNGDKRNNLDDGTAVWGNPVRQPAGNAPSSSWKPEAAKPVLNGMPNGSVPMSVNSMPRGPPPPPQGPGIMGPKPESWNKGPVRATGWGDGPMHRESPSSNSSWGEQDQSLQKSLPGTPSTPSSGLGGANINAGGGGGSNSAWGESNLATSPSSSWTRPLMKPNPTGWSDGQIDTSTWSTTKQGKPLSKDMIQASMQFRILTEKGFKKEDVENALRASGMNLETALEDLRSGNVREPTGLDADLSRMKQPTLLSNNSSSLLNNNMGMPSSSLIASIQRHAGPPSQNIQPVNQTQVASNGPPTRPNGGQASNPWQHQLRTLVQQIQLAVHAGHLNPQILNQPLAPPTLGLLYTLLQEIKELQNLNALMQQQSRPGNGAPSQMLQDIHVRMTKTKQAIQNLQNQIAAQQATFLKHQNSSQDPFTKATDSRPTMNPDLNNPGQSRLAQWKMSSFEKHDPNEFNIDLNRQTGGQVMGLKQNSPSSMGGPDMLNWGDSSSRPSNSNMGASWSDAGPNSAMFLSQQKKQNSPPVSNFADLVPEFEPGKPWKGTATKTVEDDPTITPGSIARPALSLAAGQLGNWSNTKTTSMSDSLAGLSLSSASTWSFAGQGGQGDGHSQMQNKNNNVSGWNGPSGAGMSEATGDMWGMSVSGASKPRGPPPGLAGQMKPAAGIWNDNGSYLLRNMSQPMDGSIDQMVMQHGQNM